MIDYVVGYLHNDTHVALVVKNRPEWQAGLLNGIGGKIEEFDATPAEAMTREFEEETGVYIHRWDHFLTLRGTGALVYCFATFDTNNWLTQVKTVEDEEITVVEFDLLARMPNQVVPNLNWMLPLLRQRGNYKPIEIEFYESTRGTNG